MCLSPSILNMSLCLLSPFPPEHNDSTHCYACTIVMREANGKGDATASTASHSIERLRQQIDEFLL
jgi:hypothetical protein